MKLKIRRDEMVLPRYVYEDLIRDSERARVLESCIEAEAQTPQDFYRCIFGMRSGKLLDEPIYDPFDEQNTCGSLDDILADKPDEPADNDFDTSVTMDAEANNEEPQSPPDQPKRNGKGTEPVGGGKARKKRDRGKGMALHNAGWKNVKIAEEMGCSEWSVSMIIKDEKNAVFGQ